MQQRHYTLSLDESGQASPENYKDSPLFIVSGCIIDSRYVTPFKQHVSQIKYGTWRENWNKVYFRSADIGKGVGYFSVLYDKNPSNGTLVPNDNMKTFCRDMKKFYNRKYFDIISCIIDKERAFKEKYITFKSGKRKKMKYVWSQDTVYKYTYKTILESYMCFLVARQAKGDIVAEASKQKQDTILYHELFNILHNGIPDKNIDHEEAKERMSSLNFVTKQNKNESEEIADLMGYAARLKFEMTMGKRKYANLTDYEKMAVKALEDNTLLVNTKYSDKRKNKIAKSIKGLVIIPS
jgi:hypothetical protein